MTSPHKQKFLEDFVHVLSTSGEERIHQFLVEHAFLLVAYFDLMNPVSFLRTGGPAAYGASLIHSFCAIGYDNSVMPVYPVFSKVRIAEQYVTDFVVADVASRGFINWILIELEPPTDPIFTKATRPSRCLATALTQVQDWRSWIRENRAYARKRFEGLRVRFFYRIIIGRRKSLGDLQTHRLEEIHEDLHRSTKIMHYDRLLDVARQIPDDFYEATKGNYCRAFPEGEMKRIMHYFPEYWLNRAALDESERRLPTNWGEPEPP